jgi:radical SAM superfamily enzyme YgiQ (UPF0313 family)
MNAWGIVNQIRRRVREEEGVLRKPASLQVALCHPSTYASAMSSLGFQTIYREICSHPDAAAERAFLPDVPGDYRKNRIPVLTYEREIPLSNFPIIAFSVAYELELTGILEMLDLSGIPVLKQDRADKHPLIIAGGPLTISNPSILAPYVDLIIIGEAEQLVHTFLNDASEMSRDRLLTRYSSIPGCYVPGMTAELPQPARVQPDCLPAFSQILTKKAVLTSMFLIEPERGCSRACFYCVMRRAEGRGMRLVAPEKVLSLIPAHARRIGLVGAAVTDHPRIKELIQKILASGREIGISSLRADRLDEDLVRLLAQGGYRTLTTAADGASQRIRNRINRNTTEQHLIRAAELVRDFGLQRLKLYVMMGLPGETMADIDELVRFSLELSSIAPLSLSVAPFVAKRNTPLDGAPFEAISMQTMKLSRIRLRLRGKADVKPSSVRWAWVEYMLAQGSESAGLAAMDAWRDGGSFSAWKRAFMLREVKIARQPAGSGGVGRVGDGLFAGANNAGLNNE